MHIQDVPMYTNSMSRKETQTKGDPMKYKCPECKELFDDDGLFDFHDCSTSQAQELRPKPKTFLAMMLGQDCQDALEKLENESQ